MSIGQLFVVVACILFFLAGINVQAIPNLVIWGWFCMTLGVLTSGFPLWRAP